MVEKGLLVYHFPPDRPSKHRGSGCCKRTGGKEGNYSRCIFSERQIELSLMQGAVKIPRGITGSISF
jgi:hypothetical protein